MPDVDARFQEAVSAAANALQAATLLVAIRRREHLEAPQEAIQLETAVLRAAQAIRWLQRAPLAVRGCR